jgi:hypothetical protein
MRWEYRNYPAATEMQSDLAGNYLTRAPTALLIVTEFAAVKLSDGEAIS